MKISRVGFTTYHKQDGIATDRVFSVFEDRAGEIMAVSSGPGNRETRSVNIFNGARFHGPLAVGTVADYPTWGWDQILLQNRGGEWWAASVRVCADLDR